MIHVDRYPFARGVQQRTLRNHTVLDVTIAELESVVRLVMAVVGE